MKKLTAIGLTTVVMALAGPAVRAGHVCCTPCCISWIEKTVTCYRPEWRERDVTCTITRVIPRVMVEERTCTVMIPVWTPEKRTIYVCRYVPREVEREVISCRMVPVTCTDPCTGCTYTSCRPEYVTHRVKCVVMEAVPEQREITVNVCSYRPEQRTFPVHRVVCEYRPETITYKQRYCVMVPYAAKVMVPVCCP
ncbi:MAG TPA: hypothetical protein VNK04_26805 [Gemmataceae bacterium]|nr:hypothetical protein [Gemmataceae bacterium]